MSSLKALDKELEETMATANKNLEDIPGRVRGGWANAIQEAKAKAGKLVDEYKKILGENSVAIFVQGNKAKCAEFDALVFENNGLSVDANALYDRLGEMVWATAPQDRGSNWGIAQTHRLQLGIQEVLSELKISEMPMPKTTVEPVISSKADCASHIKRIIKDAVGNMFNRRYIENNLYCRARAIRYTGKVAPVFIIGADLSEYADIGYGFKRGTSTITITEEDVVNREYLNKTLKEIAAKKSAQA